MLHCLNTSENVGGGGSCSDMTVLERQRARMTWQQQHQQEENHHRTLFSSTDLNAVFSSSSSSSSPSFLHTLSHAVCADQYSALAQVLTHSPLKPDPGFDNGWPELAAGFGSSLGFVPASAVSRTCSREFVSATEKVTSSAKEGSKKRKTEKAQNSKEISDDKEKRVKGSGEKGEFRVTERSNNKKETSSETCKDNSKDSEVQNQKPEYIHVRARRGQATDSHSLAERVRREKISERMKYLQDLVPGCNKIAGKAGMLDEIINYVQSLQRQVEFLSMKLAAVNPRLDFNIDELFAKEVFPSCAQSFPCIGMPSDMTNPAHAHLQFNSAQLVSYCGGLINNNMGVNPPSMGLRRNISTPVSLSETFLDSTCFTQILPSSSWECDFQNLYNVPFDQGKTTSFPSQQFTGIVEATNLKMEM